MMISGQSAVRPAGEPPIAGPLSRYLHRPKRFPTTALAALLLLAGCAAQPAQTPAPASTRDPAFEQRIEGELAAVEPAAVELFRAATEAWDAGDNDQARVLFQGVLAMAPDFPPALRRLGKVEADLGDSARAVELTRRALELQPDAYNQSALAWALLQQDSQANASEAYDLASRACEARPDDDSALAALAMAAGASGNMDVFRATVAHWVQVAPGTPLPHYFAGIISADDGRWQQAERELLLARSLGMPAADVQEVLDTGVSRWSSLIRAFRISVTGVVVWLGGLAALFLAGSVLSKATLRAVNDPNFADPAAVRPGERRIRSIYRTVIVILSGYFYLSIPFVVISVLLVVGGAFYIFMQMELIPIKIAVLLVIMALASLFAIVRGLFSRVRDVPPGKPLARADALELWALVDRVAGDLQVRPVDTIYLTPGVDIGVYERGSILRKLRGGGQRNLLLGMAVLPGLTQCQLAAILAHEYGHFSHKDTAGGDLAHQVEASLQQMARRLARSGWAAVYNPAWLFMLVYNHIYLRVTLGASRLQEVLADRYAALSQGGQNLIDGLLAVVRQSIEFPLAANHALNQAAEAKKPVRNLYVSGVPADAQDRAARELETELSRATSPYDSHPALKERIAWIERLQAGCPQDNGGGRPALRLLPNAEALQRELTSALVSAVQA